MFYTENGFLLGRPLYLRPSLTLRFCDPRSASACLLPVTLLPAVPHLALHPVIQNHLRCANHNGDSEHRPEHRENVGGDPVQHLGFIRHGHVWQEKRTIVTVHAGMTADDLREEEAAHFISPSLGLGRVYISSAAIRALPQSNPTHNKLPSVAFQSKPRSRICTKLNRRTKPLAARLVFSMIGGHRPGVPVVWPSRPPAFLVGPETKLNSCFASEWTLVLWCDVARKVLAVVPCVRAGADFLAESAGPVGMIQAHPEQPQAEKLWFSSQTRSLAIMPPASLIGHFIVGRNVHYRT